MFASVIAAAGGSDLTAACGPQGQQGWFCNTVFRISGNRNAAEVADALAKPLRIALVVVLALFAVWALRRLVRRVVAGVRDPDRLNLLRRRAGVPELGELERQRRVQRADTLAFVLRNVVSVFVWISAGLVILSDLGMDLAPLLAGAGVVTLVIGFGAQTVVRDYLAGLFMILEDQFGIGDVIDVGDQSGTVEWVSLRVTRLRDVDGVVWWVPNGEIKRLGNKSQQWSRALLDVVVAHDSDLGQVREVIESTAAAMWTDGHWQSLLLGVPEFRGVEDVGAAGIKVRVVARTRPQEQQSVARELRIRLKHAFDDAGIAMPGSG